jgi:class 3 adenylate cyclase/tetratricopeptide (TPR) repeat protein
VSFLETVERARGFLERSGRVSIRALQREFGLDAGDLDELVEELVAIQRVAVRDGPALTWIAGASSAPTRGPVRERAPRDYTPRHLADKILTSHSAIEGERKRVTVLFADIKGSMELAEMLGPEEWHGILDHFFAIANEGVHRFEGTVTQYTGDGVMALFGAPIAHEDHAQRACYAALHLRDGLRSFGNELRLERGLSLSTRMGLNSGEVVVGKIGDDLRMDYTAQGQVVNVAQRMEQLAESGRVYLTEQTAEVVSGYFRLREIGPTRIKGLREPLTVHELEGAGEFQSRFDVSRARGLSRFVGRELEMARLEAALEHGLRDRCRFVGVVAEAGTGKSRLVHEFLERCRERGLRLITAGCPPHGKSIPFGLSMAANRSLFGVLETDDRETARNKVAGQMSRADPALASDIPFMLDFMGLAEPGSASTSLDPQARLREVVRIVERLLVPMGFDVLVFEDLHWADPASETVTVQISRADLPNRRFKIFTYRPEYRPAEADWPEFEEIRLEPLSADSTSELVRDLLGSDPSVSGLEGVIQQRAAGNPFYVEEIVHSLAESGQLEGARGAYRRVGATAEIDVPDSVQAVLAARIDRLDELAKRTLHSAAVVGLEFPVSVVAEVAEIPRRDVDAALHVLSGSNLVYQLAAYPEVEYAFTHPLIQSVASDTQLSAPRRHAHATIARVLERRHEDKLEEKAGLIAYHWEEAGEQLEGARWHARAAAWLESRDLAEAASHWRTARSLIGDEPSTSDAAELATEACTQLLELGWRQGMSEEEAERVFADGLDCAGRGGGAHAHARLLNAYASQRGLVGNIDEMRAYNDEALQVAAPLGDRALSLALASNQIYCLMLGDHLPHALEQAERAREDAIEFGHADLRTTHGFHVISNCLLVAGASLLWMGRLQQARTTLEEALALARRHRDADTICFAHYFLVECCNEMGDASSALHHGRAGVEVAESQQTHYTKVVADWGLARALIGDEDPDEACTLLENALATAREQRISLNHEGGLLQQLAEARRLRGDLDGAREACDEAVAAAHRSRTRIWECDAWLSLARVLLALEAPAAEEIARALERAQQLIDETGGEGRRPHLDELHAGLARALGDAAGRERHLREAHRLYVEMRGGAHAARVARELAEL